MYRSNGRINEAKKFGWKTYCSRECQKKVLSKKEEFQCARPNCSKIFMRAPHDIRSTLLYCSQSCAATINNSKHPKRKARIKKCLCCEKNFKGEGVYCSRSCKDRSQVITAEEVSKSIKEFYLKNGRIPLKRENLHYHAARLRFGSWNKAILAAGLNPNPVKFANKYLARDGHLCDSMAEKIIDDWFSEKGVKHKRNIKYPGNPKLTVDFVTKHHWIEFFGLFGEIKDYDALVREKQKLARKYKLPLVELYPKDLFPVSRLPEKLLG